MDLGQYDIAGKIVVVTGGGSGLSFGVVKLAISRGARVVIGDLRLIDEAERFVREHEEKKDVIFQKCDVTDWSALEGLIALAEKTFGSVPDVYVAGAGIFEPTWSNFWNDTAKEHFAELEVNTVHPIKLTQLALQTFRRTGKKGVVLLVSSVAGYFATFASPVYCASKSALLGFTRSMELTDSVIGVKVVTLCPGVVDTNVWTAETRERYMVDKVDALTSDEVAQTAVELIQEARYPGGTVLEVTRAGTRIIEAPLVPSVPEDYVNHINAPLLQMLKTPPPSSRVPDA